MNADGAPFYTSIRVNPLCILIHPRLMVTYHPPAPRHPVIPSARQPVIPSSPRASPGINQFLHASRVDRLMHPALALEGAAYDYAIG
jgi:hypothetical protein